MFFDTDAGGVVHNLAYLRIIEVARTRLGAELGLPVKEMAERGEFSVVLRTEVDYRQPARLGDHLVVESWLEKVERLRFWLGFRILRPGDTLVTRHVPPTDGQHEDSRKPAAPSPGELARAVP